MHKTERVLHLSIAASTFAVAFSWMTINPATARGFCNIDKLGSTEMLQMVADAGAAFFDGGGHLMTMLSALERSDKSKAEAAGLQAAKLFGSANNLYMTAAGKASEIKVDFSVVKMDVVAIVAQTSQSFPIFVELTKNAQSANAPRALVMYCAAESTRMASATEGFLKSNRDLEKPYAALLAAWGRALYVGRVVSAIFAVAGGEPEK